MATLQSLRLTGARRHAYVGRDSVLDVGAPKAVLLKGGEGNSARPRVAIPSFDVVRASQIKSTHGSENADGLILADKNQEQLRGERQECATGTRRSLVAILTKCGSELAIIFTMTFPR